MKGDYVVAVAATAAAAAASGGGGVKIIVVVAAVVFLFIPVMNDIVANVCNKFAQLCNRVNLCL